MSKKEIKLIEEISSFINNNLVDKTNRVDALAELIKLSDYFQGLCLNKRIDITVDTYEYLFNQNQKIVKLIKNIICTCKSMSELKKITNDMFIVEMLEAYSFIHDLFNEEETVDIKDSGNNFIKEVLAIPNLSIAELNVLLSEISKSNNKEAFEKLFKSHLKLIVPVVMGYKRGALTEDLIQEGALGLIEAIKRFDSRKGKSFQKYALIWIRKYIREFLAEKSRIIRVPEYLIDKTSKIKITKEEFERKYHREPTSKEISEFIGMDEDEIRYINNIEKKESLYEIVSSDNGVDSTYEDVIPGTILPPEDIAMNYALHDDLIKIFDKCLTKREKNVLCMRYGNKRLTQKQCAKIYGITYQGIAQIEKKALQKIRTYITLMGFEDYMDNPEEALIYLKNNKKA